MRRLLALVAVVAAGCAGGGDDEPTRAEWAAKANEVCRAYERRVAALGTPATAAAATSFIRRAVPLAREEVRAVRELEEPPTDAARIEQMLAAAEEGIDALAAIPEGADADPARARAERAAARADTIARELGADHCASGRSG